MRRSEEARPLARHCPRGKRLRFLVIGESLRFRGDSLVIAQTASAAIMNRLMLPASEVQGARQGRGDVEVIFRRLV